MLTAAAMVLANSSPMVKWTIVAGFVTVGAAAVGFSRMKDKAKTGSWMFFGCLGIFQILYGWWGSRSDGTYVYHVLFFALPVAAVLLAIKQPEPPSDVQVKKVDTFSAPKNTVDESDGSPKDSSKEQHP